MDSAVCTRSSAMPDPSRMSDAAEIAAPRIADDTPRLNHFTYTTVDLRLTPLSARRKLSHPDPVAGADLPRDTPWETRTSRAYDWPADPSEPSPRSSRAYEASGHARMPAIFGVRPRTDPNAGRMPDISGLAITVAVAPP